MDELETGAADKAGTPKTNVDRAQDASQTTTTQATAHAQQPKPSPPPTSSIDALPALLALPSSTPPVLITQGAEARLYRTTYLTPDLPCALKHRPPKPYRHPALDARLTRARLLAEARMLQRCRRDAPHVAVPALYAVLEGAGCLLMEWVAGAAVRVEINALLARRGGGGEGEADAALRVLLARVGEAVGGLHKVGVVHGDLTTSNLMWRRVPGADGHAAGGAGGLSEGEIVVIDFGLASQSSSDEDRAVDLYVLERAFMSTHPSAEVLFADVLAAYGKSFKGAGTALRRLEDVRMRGRKKSMLG